MEFWQHRAHVLVVSRYVKFIYSEKATKFFEISTNYLSYVLRVKLLVEISQNFVAFSEYMNFMYSVGGRREQYFLKLSIEDSKP